MELLCRAYIQPSGGKNKEISQLLQAVPEVWVLLNVVYTGVGYITTNECFGGKKGAPLASNAPIAN